MVTIDELLDLSKTIAAELFEGKTYPWEVLDEIKPFILKLGETLPGTTVLLNHMKELWAYMGQLFPEGGKCLKEIRRAGNRVQYEAAVRVLLSSCRIEKNKAGL